MCESGRYRGLGPEPRGLGASALALVAAVPGQHLVATEDMRPRDLRNAVDRVSTAYPTLADVVEYLSDWA